MPPVANMTLGSKSLCCEADLLGDGACGVLDMDGGGVVGPIDAYGAGAGGGATAVATESTDDGSNI